MIQWFFLHFKVLEDTDLDKRVRLCWPMILFRSFRPNLDLFGFQKYWKKSELTGAHCIWHKGHFLSCVGLDNTSLEFELLTFSWIWDQSAGDSS